MSDKTKLPIEIAADFFDITVSQAEELRFRMNGVRSRDNGWGFIKIWIKRGFVYGFDHYNRPVEPTIYPIEE